MDKNILYVELLGKIQLKNKQGTVNRQTLHSAKLIYLLTYILLNRNEEITMQRLCEALWKEGESANPVGALKNLIYRLRNSLKILGNKEYILTGNNSYRWNPDLPVKTDFEEFSDCCGGALDKTKPEEERIQNAERAFELYKGPLPLKETKQWALPVDTYYLSLYVDVIKYLSDSYKQAGKQDKVEQISASALAFAGFDEELHCNVIQSLLDQGKHTLALSHYNKAMRQIHDQPGNYKTPKLKLLYEKLISWERGGNESVQDILKDMEDVEEDNGVFMCEYGVFKEIYRLERRKLVRTEASECILLLTMAQNEELGHLDRAGWNRLYKKMEQVVKTSLRRGDAAARCSDQQYVLLLPDCTPGTADIVADRIIKGFNKRVQNKKVKISYEIKNITGDSNMNVEEVLKTSL